jgi:hypothetical protein
MSIIKHLRLYWLNRGTHGFIEWLWGEYGEPVWSNDNWQWGIRGTTLVIVVSRGRVAWLQNLKTKTSYKLEITDWQESYVARSIIKSLVSIERNSW